MKKVLIIAGSESDFERIRGLTNILSENHIDYDFKSASCHRDIENLNILLDELKKEPYLVIIAVANSVSNMPAIVASALKETKIIVVGVGLDDKGLNGIDSLLSVNTIPKGVPLVNTGIGEVGLVNAGLFAKKLIS